MRNGKKTGSPLSATVNNRFIHIYSISWGRGVPGWIVESTTFFARHSSGVMLGIWLCLYEVMSLFAFSRPVDETNIILVYYQLCPLNYKPIKLKNGQF